MGQTNRNSRTGCAIRVDSKKAKYPQTLLLKVHYETSVPFGQDRLIPIWVATLALRQKSRTVHFERAAQMLEFFRFPKDGRYYRRLVQGFHRIFASTIFFGTEEQPAGGRLIDWARFTSSTRFIFGSTNARIALHPRPTIPRTPLPSAKPSTRRSTGTPSPWSARL